MSLPYGNRFVKAGHNVYRPVNISMSQATFNVFAGSMSVKYNVFTGVYGGLGLHRELFHYASRVIASLHQ